MPQQNANINSHLVGCSGGVKRTLDTGAPSNSQLSKRGREGQLPWVASSEVPLATLFQLGESTFATTDLSSTVIKGRRIRKRSTDDRKRSTTVGNTMLYKAEEAGQAIPPPSP